MAARAHSQKMNNGGPCGSSGNPFAQDDKSGGRLRKADSCRNDGRRRQKQIPLRGMTDRNAKATAKSQGKNGSKAIALGSISFFGVVGAVVVGELVVGVDHDGCDWGFAFGGPDVGASGEPGFYRQFGAGLGAVLEGDFHGGWQDELAAIAQ